MEILFPTRDEKKAANVLMQKGPRKKMGLRFQSLETVLFGPVSGPSSPYPRARGGEVGKGSCYG